MAACLDEIGKPLDPSLDGDLRSGLRSGSGTLVLSFLDGRARGELSGRPNSNRLACFPPLIESGDFPVRSPPSGAARFARTPSPATVQNWSGNCEARWRKRDERRNNGSTSAYSRPFSASVIILYNEDPCTSDILLGSVDNF